VEQAVLFADGPSVCARDLPVGGSPAEPSALERPPGLRERIREATRLLERKAIEQALQATHGNVTRAARALGLSRRGLQLKMKELGIERP
jgi:DNA-binding NtrC family response regulator